MQKQHKAPACMGLKTVFESGGGASCQHSSGLWTGALDCRHEWMHEHTHQHRHFVPEHSFRAAKSGRQRSGREHGHAWSLQLTTNQRKGCPSPQRECPPCDQP